MSRVATIPADSLYWSVLDGSLVDLRAGASRDDQLTNLFERDIPCDVEDVQVVFSRDIQSQSESEEDDNVAVIAAAIPIDLLQSTTDKRSGLTVLSPETYPERLRDENIGAPLPDLRSLNFLVGEFEPPRVQQAKRGLTRLMVIGSILIGVMAFFMFEMRRNAVLREARTVRSTLNTLYDSVVPAGTESALNQQPPELRLEVELRSLQRTRGQEFVPDEIGFDISRRLADVFAVWPKDEIIRVDSLVIDRDRVIARFAADESESVQTLSDALTSLAWLRPNAPQITQQRGEVQGVLSFDIAPKSVASRETP